jgi:hypothetical protein
MASGNVSKVLRAPGRLVIKPTDLTVEFPYGGIEVGKTKLVVLTSFNTSVRIECEGLGNEASDVLERTSRYVFTCFIRAWDDDAIQQFFSSNFVQGSVTGHSLLREPGNRVAGASALSRAVSMLYVPDDPISNPAVLIYEGIPDWSENAELAFQRQEELGLPIAVECVRNSSGNILEVGRLADLSLS